MAALRKFYKMYHPPLAKGDRGGFETFNEMKNESGRMEKDTDKEMLKKQQKVQLKRLRRLIDVVFALVIWRIFTLIPKPEDTEWHWDEIAPFLTENIMTFAVILIGIVIVIIYWLQHNALFNNLERTDSRHTALSILQVFCLLLFLFSIRLGAVLEPSEGTRAFESAMAALLGITLTWSWAYAIKQRRLISPEVTDAHAHHLLDRSMAEPLTALITLPIAFVGGVYWEISWLTYPLVVFLLRRRRSRL